MQGIRSAMKRTVKNAKQWLLCRQNAHNAILLEFREKSTAEKTKQIGSSVATIDKLILRLALDPQIRFLLSCILLIYLRVFRRVRFHIQEPLHAIIFNILVHA